MSRNAHYLILKGYMCYISPVSILERKADYGSKYTKSSLSTLCAGRVFGVNMTSAFGGLCAPSTVLDYFKSVDETVELM